MLNTQMSRRSALAALSAPLVALTLPKRTLGGEAVSTDVTAEDKRVGGSLKDGDISEPVGGSRRADLPAYLDNLFFVNGLVTDGPGAVMQARVLGNALRCPVRAIFNDLTRYGVDHAAIALDKIFNFEGLLNKAHDTIVSEVSTALAAEKPISFVGFSAGAIVLLNALRSFVDDYEDEIDDDDERNKRLGRIRVLTIGSGAFTNDHFLSAGWPKELGSVYHLFHKADWVSQVAGPGEWGDFRPAAHSFVRSYLPAIDSKMLSASGSKRIE